jgi:pilus assembly protein CpaB
VPRRFAPEGAIASPAAVTGLRAAVDIAAGTDITVAMVGDGRAPPVGPAIRRGERVARVVALASPELVTPGSHVDVLVTPEPRDGASGEAVLALEDVEVLDAVPAAGDAPGGGSSGRSEPGARVDASLRVTLRQAIYLAAAQDFARELRLLPRSDADHERGWAGMRAGAQLP